MKKIIEIVAYIYVSWWIILFIARLIAMLVAMLRHQSIRSNLSDKKELLLAVLGGPILIAVSPILLIYGIIENAKTRPQRLKIKKNEQYKQKAISMLDKLSWEPLSVDFFLMAKKLLDNGEAMDHLKEFHLNVFDVLDGVPSHDLLDGIDSLSMPKGKYLEIEPPSGKGCGSASTIVVTDKGEYKNTSIFDDVIVEDSIMGAWMAYRLYELWHNLTLFWHANYDKRTYYFSNEKLQEFTLIYEGGDPMGKCDNQDVNISNSRKTSTNVRKQLLKFDVTPMAAYNGEFYFLRSYYWNEFGGFFRETVAVRIVENKVMNIFEIEEENLYRYSPNFVF